MADFMGGIKNFMAARGSGIQRPGSTGDITHDELKAHGIVIDLDQDPRIWKNGKRTTDGVTYDNLNPQEKKKVDEGRLKAYPEG